jgi:hypothetical protein
MLFDPHRGVISYLDAAVQSFSNEYVAMTTLINKGFDAVTFMNKGLCRHYIHG